MYNLPLHTINLYNTGIWPSYIHVYWAWKVGKDEADIDKIKNLGTSIDKINNKIMIVS